MAVAARRRCDLEASRTRVLKGAAQGRGGARCAASGFTASEAVSELGLSVGGLEVDGALSSDRLSEVDIAGGAYDNARVEVWLVNWAAPEERLVLRIGDIGEIERADNAFRAEIRGLSHALDQEQGRIFQYDCDADFGDARCGVDGNQPAYSGNGTVLSSSDARLFDADGLSGYADGWFTRGRLNWTGGANAGRVIEVKGHTFVDTTAAFTLWQPMSAEIAAGDTFIVVAGCDKRFETCALKFANVLNFRGFPHMPGNDYTVHYAKRGGNNDGGSLM
ncbi:MAG: DUF2163 domain-containing protein [Hyphomicrobiales bacterium]|nr:DUF2163 domain-containing protein [Hyphomicrobiales bacterium]